MNITKASVEKLIPPKQIREGRTEQKRYYDLKLKGFGVRITSGGTKAFFVEKLINQKLKRITLGHYPALATEQARKQAQIVLGKIAIGIDPVAEKRSKKVKSIRLKQVFNDYLAARKSLKSVTILDYQRVLEQVVPDWLDKPLISITRDWIVKRHTQHGEERSKARANLAMRLLRAIFNFAINQYQDDEGRPFISDNPVKRLSHTRAWYRIERRQTVIKRHQLADWYSGLKRLSEVSVNVSLWQDYFLLVLFTGLRRQEAASLKWTDVDLIDKTFILQDTKNRQSHRLPMSDFIYDLFLRRKRMAKDDFVFSANSRSGHMVEPRKMTLKVSELSGVQFTIHDLRRTFITVAESLDIPAYALKRLLNHKMSQDITAGYIVMDAERLRRPMQTITDHLVKLMGINKN